LATTFIAAEGVEQADSPSVLLITLDTLRADRLGCYGHEPAATPNLDALAEEGVRFARAQSPAPLTAPSHASMMTGLVPRRHQVRDNALHPLPPGIPVLAALLAARGFDTVAAVSAAVLDRGSGLARGFRLYEDQVRVGPRAAFNYEERAATQTNAAIRGELDKLEPPFFVWIHYFDPHLPYVPPAPFDRRFADPYDGEVAFVDQAVGRLLEQVRSRWPRTWIVVAGDHGESLGDHDEESHGVFIYQSTQRVPLSGAGPGIRGGRSVEEQVGLVDVMPTILDLLDIELPPDVDGRTLVPLLEGAKTKNPGAYEMESWFPHFAYDWSPLRGLIRDGLVAIDAPRPELYDLRQDPGQTRNLWPGHRKGKRLLRELRELSADADPLAVEADPETAERLMRLRSLGYAGGVQPPGGHEALDPKDGIGLLPLLESARASVQHGRAHEALAPLADLLKRNPRNVPARLTLVAALLATGDPAAAVAEARLAAAVRPRDDLVRFNLANALAAEAALRPAAAEEARRQYDRTLHLNPRRADAYLNYAAFLARGGELPAAREVLVAAESAGVLDPDLAVERGVLELRSGNADVAVGYLEKALVLDPSADDALEALARLAMMHGRPAEARAHLQRLLELRPPGHPARGRVEGLLRQLETP
jgi:arylsulfatase A-like enzyme/Tfp pilus assembly protein PilF